MRESAARGVRRTRRDGMMMHREGGAAPNRCLGRKTQFLGRHVRYNYYDERDAKLGIQFSLLKTKSRKKNQSAIVVVSRYRRFASTLLDSIQKFEILFSIWRFAHFLLHRFLCEFLVFFAASGGAGAQKGIRCVECVLCVKFIDYRKPSKCYQ